ncbi:MAG TPA: C25 family cysteine peptidase [Planctomycetota bacterium]
MIAVILSLVAAQDATWVRRDLDVLRADWLAVAPPPFTDALAPLCARRARTFKVAVARTDDVEARFGKGPEGIARLVAAAKPKYLLLAGDADRVPTFTRNSAYVSERFASDPDLATDQLFGVPTGRFPADTAEELRAMAEKTVAYETAPSPGGWRRRIAFITGEGGFGPLIDTVLERQFSTLVADAIPAGYDVETAYAKPASKYFYYAPKFNENAVRLLNEGPLFYVYVGHGMRERMDDVRYKDFLYPILGSKDAARIDSRGGPPIMVSIACNTGEFDSRLSDCVGEELFKRRRGPVAFVGGTRVTQPYGNALLGRHLIGQVFHARARTIGEAMAGAKEAVLGADDSALRTQADALAGFVQGPGSLEPMRRDVVLQYNLFGDPALVIRRPDHDLAVEAPKTAKPGATIRVSGAAEDAADVSLTLECGRDAFCRPTDLEEGDLEKAVARRYANANDKVLVRLRPRAYDGAFEAALDIPRDAKPGRYWIKVASDTALGWREIEISSP